MRKTKCILALSVLLLALLACNFVAPQATPQSTTTPVIGLTTIVEPTSSLPSNLPRDENAVPRVSLEQALTALDSGAAIFVDVRSKQAYDASHVKGAVSIPLAEIETNPTGLALDKDQWIITYCT